MGIASTRLGSVFEGSYVFHFEVEQCSCSLDLSSPCLPKAIRANFVKMGVELREQIQTLLGEDAILLYPSHPSTALSHHRPSLAPFNFSYTSIFNVLHLPVTQCPLGLDRNGLPLGIQIAAGRNNDRLSIAVAKQLERHFGGWNTCYPGKNSQKKQI